MNSGHKTSAGATENRHQNALLAWASGRIDELAAAEDGAARVGDLLDWLAHFTRESFGFQQRMLNECSEQRQYLLERMAVHGEFRRRLAQLCIDAIRHDASVADRLCDLCHDLLADARAQEARFSRILRDMPGEPRLRREVRQGEPAATAADLFRTTPSH